MLNGLDLFSGIGGNSLALSGWINTVAYCEGDAHAQAVLMSRMREGLLPNRPIWDDVRSLRGEWLPPIDIIVGGFPCQDISVAGKGKGLEGERSGLFFEIVRLAEEIKPTFLFLENVPAIRTRGLGRVIEELTALGYDLRWTMLSAQEVGANHKRERWFCLASNADNYRRWESIQQISEQIREKQTDVRSDGSVQPMADSNSSRCLWKNASQSKKRKYSIKSTWPSNNEGWDKSDAWWKTEPDVGRVADGVSFRVDRLKRLGNAVVPLQAREAFKELMGIK